MSILRSFRSSLGAAIVSVVVFSQLAQAQVSVPRGRPQLNDARTTFVADNGELLRGPYESTEWTSAAPEAEVAKIKELGCNTVHLYAEVYNPNYPAAGNAPGYAQAEVDKFVEMTRELGLYLILTIGNGANNGNHNYQYAVDFWNHYAPRYADEPHVVYEIHNEPMAWGPSYLTGTSPANTMAMEIAAYQAIRSHAPDTPVLMFSYAVIGGNGGFNAAMTDIEHFNQQVFGNPNAIWENEAVGFHGYAGWRGTAEAVALLIDAGYPCVMTEFAATDWGTQQGGLDVEMVSELERLQVSWATFQFIPPSGVSDDVTDPVRFRNRVEKAGLSWTPDFGDWPPARGPYGNEGQPRSTPGLSGTLRIEVEDFDNGAQGVAYHDVDTGNQGRGYRSRSDVDMKSTSDVGGGFKVGWTEDGEWLEYTIWVTEPGYHDLRLRYAAPADGASVLIEFNGVEAAALDLPATGSGETWATASQPVFLEWGRQKLRLEIVSGGADFNWLELAPVSSGILGNGSYKLINRNSGQLAQADTTDNLLRQNVASGGTDQRWNLVHRGAGQYSIGSAASGSRYWSTFYNGNGDSVNLNTWGYDGSADRRFILRPSGDGFYFIQVVDGGKSVEVANASFSPGADIQQWVYANGSQQQWGVVSPDVPGVPAGLTAVGVSPTQIDLDWGPVSGITHYSVHRAMGEDGAYSVIAPRVSRPEYTDSDVVLGLTYRYMVIAHDGLVQGLPSAPAVGRPFGVIPNEPSPIAEELYNINMAGQQSDPAPVASGTVIAAPSLVPGADQWNNLTSPNFWNFNGPRTVLGADGSGTITVDWAGESGDHLVRWNSGSYYGIFRSMFGDPGDPWDLTMTFSGLDPESTYDIYWYSTWPESENPVVNTVVEGTCESPTQTMYPERDHVAGASDYSQLEVNVNYTIHADIRPSAGGLIRIRSQGDNVSVAGIQIVKRPPSVPPPSAPGIVAATAGDGAALLDWNEVAGAMGYQVRRTTRSGQSYTLVASDLLENSFVDSGLLNGRTYYYVVAAVGAGGEGAASQEVSVVPRPPIREEELESPSVEVVDGTIRLVLDNSVIGHEYQLQYRFNLDAGTWMNYGEPQPGNGAALLLSMPLDPESHDTYFLRIGVSLE